MSAGFRVTQSAYAAALGVWCGALAMLGLAAAAAFEVIPRYEPALGRPPFDAPPLAERASQVLAGAVVNQSLSALSVLGAAAVAVAVASAAVQCWAYPDRLSRGGVSAPNVLRIGLLVILAGLVFYDRLSLSPAVDAMLAVMYDPHATPMMRQDARYRFDILHARSELLHQATLLLALVALAVAPFCYRVPSPHRGLGR